MNHRLNVIAKKFRCILNIFISKLSNIHNLNYFIKFLKIFLLRIFTKISIFISITKLMKISFKFLLIFFCY